MSPAVAIRIQDLARVIDWDELGNDLAKGILDRLDEETAKQISQLAELPEVEQLGLETKTDPLRIVVALLSLPAGWMKIRSAKRVATALAREIESEKLLDLAIKFGIDPADSPSPFL